jgi:multicomponent K+:H+ antiporter subunit D
LLAVAGLGRAGTALFWATSEAPVAVPVPAQPLALGGVAVLLAALVALTLAAGPVSGWLGATAAALYSPASYIVAVLGGGAI